MNVYNNDEDREKYLNNYFTPKGREALTKRLYALAKEHTLGREYPYIARMLGFPTLRIHSKQHHEGMIDDLCQILGIKELTIEVKNDS